MAVAGCGFSLSGRAKSTGGGKGEGASAGFASCSACGAEGPGAEVGRRWNGRGLRRLLSREPPAVNVALRVWG